MEAIYNEKKPKLSLISEYSVADLSADVSADTLGRIYISYVCSDALQKQSRRHSMPCIKNNISENLNM